MDVIAVLIVFSGLAALLAARARAGGLALLFGGLALVLFCFTPAGAGLPGGLASLVGWIGTETGHAVGGGAA